jgi:hypothetical protein
MSFTSSSFPSLPSVNSVCIPPQLPLLPPVNPALNLAPQPPLIPLVILSETSPLSFLCYLLCAFLRQDFRHKLTEAIGSLPVAWAHRKIKKFGLSSLHGHAIRIRQL